MRSGWNKTLRGASALLLAAVVCCWCGARAAQAQEPEATTPAAQTVESAPAEASPSPTGDCERLAKMIDQQKSQMTRDMGQLKREIAALRQDISEPGLAQVFAGIGYILGLAGVGFYMHARSVLNKSKTKE
jgi:nickel transport protein